MTLGRAGLHLGCDLGSNLGRNLTGGLALGLGMLVLGSNQAGSAEASETTPAPLELALPAPGDPAWQPLLFRSIETPTQYHVGTDPEGRPAFRASSTCGASALTVPLPSDLDLGRWPRLAWRWRIQKALDVPQERTKAGDDFAGRVYVLFRFDAERASAFERFQRGIGRRLFGVEMPGRTLNYVWASRVPVGEKWTSPYHDDAKLIAVRSRPIPSSSKTGTGWHETIVHWKRDAERLFSPPPRSEPYALGIMTDADGVCEEAIAWFSDFRLLGPESTPDSP